MRIQEHEELWNRIAAFEFDDNAASVRFSDKLASSQNWPAAFTRRAIDEYRKFIFLCCISPSGASPSPVVDEVWHLHLTYTQQYWKEFCGKTLGREIHHHPSKGGPEEKDRHAKWYAATLVLYRRVFNQDPPYDIWPPASLPKAETSLPAPAYGPAYRDALPLLLLPFLFPFLFGRLHPFALTGPQFLLFFPLLLIAAAVVLLRAFRIKKEIVGGVAAQFDIGGANVYQVARYVYGNPKAVQAAVVDLVARDVLVPVRGEKLIFHPSRSKFSQDQENPLAQNLLWTYEEGAVLKMRDLTDCYNEELTAHSGLSELYRVVQKTDPYQIAVPGFVMLVGVVRLIQGWVNERPTGYLWGMMLVGFLGLYLLTQELSGKKLLQHRFKTVYQDQALAFASGQSLAACFLFLGLAALPGIENLGYLDSAFRNHVVRNASGDSGSSCGGSSCGGGGCGGGCGGCGGGD